MLFYLMRRPSYIQGLGDAFSIKVIPPNSEDGYTIPQGIPLAPTAKKEDALVLLTILLGRGRICLRQNGEKIEVVHARLNGDMKPEFVPDPRFEQLDLFKTVAEIIEGILRNNPSGPFSFPGSVFEVPDAQLRRYNLRLRTA